MGRFFYSERRDAEFDIFLFMFLPDVGLDALGFVTACRDLLVLYWCTVRFVLLITVLERVSEECNVATRVLIGVADFASRDVVDKLVPSNLPQLKAVADEIDNCVFLFGVVCAELIVSLLSLSANVLIEVCFGNEVIIIFALLSELSDCFDIKDGWVVWFMHSVCVALAVPYLHCVAPRSVLYCMSA